LSRCGIRPANGKAFAKVKKDQSDRPLENVRMFVTVEEMSKKKITKEYGYVYAEAEHKK